MTDDGCRTLNQGPVEEKPVLNSPAPKDNFEQIATWEWTIRIRQARSLYSNGVLAETCQRLEEGYKSRKLWKALGCQSRALPGRATLQKAGHRQEQQEQVSHPLISGRPGRLKAGFGNEFSSAAGVEGRGG